MANIAHEPVKKAMSRIRELSADEETRRLALVRERALRDEVSFLNEAKQEGRLEGFSGLLRIQLASKFGELPLWVEAKLDAATDEQLSTWGTRMLTAKSLDELFKP